jgi:hypothetical protein
MINRPIIHVAGPSGAGKTQFILAMLRSKIGIANCARGERDTQLAKIEESKSMAHTELLAYRSAGAGAVAQYRFPELNTEAFYTSSLMEHYSELVFIEGDSPIQCNDLTVFVVAAPASGKPLLRRAVEKPPQARRTAEPRNLDRGREAPDVLFNLLCGEGDERMKCENPGGSRLLDALRRLAAESRKSARIPERSVTEHWCLEDGFEGIQHAQLIIVNVRGNADRDEANRFIGEIPHLRKDPDVFRDVVGPYGNKLPVTAVVADLSNLADLGTRKAVARVKRTVRRSTR